MSVNENEDIDFSIISVSATDQDIGDNGAILYSILSSDPANDKFYIDPVSICAGLCIQDCIPLWGSICAGSFAASWLQ